MTTTFDHDQIVDLLEVAQFAYERYRVHVVNAFPEGRVRLEELTDYQREIHEQLLEAERAIADHRRRVHSHPPCNR